MAQVVVGKKYDPYTGKWKDVYGPAPKGGGGSSSTSKKKPPKKQPSTSKKSSPPKPATGDKKNDHRGSGEDNKNDTVEVAREIEYDLEGSAEIRPMIHLKAREIIDFKGLGINFSGTYFMSSVTHTINRGGYSQSLGLLRRSFVWKTSTIKPPPPNPKPPAKPKKKPKKPPVKKKRYHTVKRGDTLWAISRRYYGRGALYMRIVNANRGKIKDPHWIYPGQSFLIP